jgi:multidrug efflux pump subunit AcrA (membrane-fusion protein)
MNTERTRASWLVYALGALCAGAIVAAVLVVGPASGSTTTVTRTATVAQGVVQSTVSGSGNLQAASQLNLGFKTSGTVTDIYVSQGEHVTQGQLLATLDPQSSEVTLEQAKASLLSAEANLAKEEETNGEGTTSGGSANSATAGAATASTASTASVRPADVADVATTAAAPAADGAPTATAPTTSTPTTTTGTTPSPTTPSTTTSTTPATPTSTTSSPSTNTATTPTATTPSKTTTTRGSTAAEPTTTTKAGSTSSSASAPVSAATREANLASARAAVKSDKLTVESDEQAVQNTKLYAPESGTIVSLSGQVGETVSGGGTTKASSTSSSSESTGGGTTGAAATTGARSSTSTTGSSSSTSSSSSSFAVLSDLSTMKLVVPLSESEIGNVKDGQIATVTVEALSGAKLAAHVSEVALTSTSNSGVVSYDVTFQLDQMEGGLKTGMSATAEVIVKQAEGINVPTSAISADSVTVERSGKQVRERVVTGLAGNTSTIILSGLKAGETVVLPAATTTSSSTSGAASRLGSRLGGAGGGLAGAAGGGGGFAGGGGGAAFFRGGG